MSPKGWSRMCACVAHLVFLVTSTAGAQKEDRKLSIQNRCATASSTIVVAMTAHPDDYTALGKYIRKLRVPMNAEMRDPPTDQDFDSALYGAMSVPQDMRKMGTEAVHHAMVSGATPECVLHNLDEARKPRIRRPP